MQSVSVLYFCYETECTITTLFSEEQNTLPKYVTKIRYKIKRILCNVFCFFLYFLHNCKAGFSSQANFLLAAWRHT